MDSVIERIILGDSPAIEAVRFRISKVARASLPVLIQGPTGSGKELVAQALHRASGRPGPLVAYNVCAAADTMFEDTFFGHVAGAFTGARSDSPGLLAEADGGTLFLDEVGALSLGSQAKLLRAAELREFRSVGARSDRRSDFRLVSAMNRCIDDLIAEGAFRTDFARRLSGIVINVPPLRDRLSDVPLLARHFLRQSGDERAGFLTLSLEAIEVLMDHDWPDNVRELRHTIECSVLLHEMGAVIPADVVVAALQQRSADSGPRLGAEAVERREVLAALDACSWRRQETADMLGIHRTTLYRRLVRWGIETIVHAAGYRRLRAGRGSLAMPDGVAPHCATPRPIGARRPTCFEGPNRQLT